MSPGSLTQQLVTPYACARDPLHDPPHVHLRIHVVLLQRPLLGKEPFPFLEQGTDLTLFDIDLPGERNDFTLFPLFGLERRFIFHAFVAHDAANARLDEIAMEEDGMKGVAVAWIGLHHAHPGPSAFPGTVVVEDRVNALRHEDPCIVKSTEGGRKGIFITPAGTTLCNEGIEIVWTELIVPCHKAKSLITLAWKTWNESTYPPVPLLIPHHLP